MNVVQADRSRPILDYRSSTKGLTHAHTEVRVRLEAMEKYGLIRVLIVAPLDAIAGQIDRLDGIGAQPCE